MPDLRLRAAVPADHAALRALAPATFDQHLRQPRYRPTFTRVAEQNGALVGGALLAHRRLRLGAATIEAGAIDALLQAPALAGGALPAELLGDCLGVLLDEGLPLVVLAGDETELGPYGFARYRFEALAELASPPVDAQQPARLRLAAPADAEDLAALYEASYRGIALAEVRAAPDWRALLEARPMLVLEDARGRAIAYAAAGAPVPEAAAADAGAARALLAALGGQNADGGLRLALPPRHSVVQAALHLGGVLSVQAARPGGPAPLAGVVDLPALLGQLAPEIERRLERSRYAGWQGSLRFELAAERVTLAFAQGRATIFDGTRPADVRLRHVELCALAQLCLGYRAAADLRATGGLACDDAALGLIDALFTPGPNWD